MKILYLDLKNGISGDMTVGALLDLGADERFLREGLSRLGIDDEYYIKINRINKDGIIATDFDVVLHEHHHDHDHDHEHHHSHGRNYADIVDLITNAGLPMHAEELALSIFEKIAQAESAVHGVDIDKVHFHEVGAVDSIVDIVGTALCIASLSPDRIYASPVNTGSGTVKCAHGILPVPAPATARLLIGIPAFSSGVPYELTTPTGAGIVAAVVDEFRDMPVMTVKGIGYGAGKRKLEYPNCLQVLLGETPETARDIITCLETNLDDVTGEVCGYLIEKLIEAGALDCYYTSIIMKKSRPGYKLTVLCHDDKVGRLEDIIFTETTTLGIRRTTAQRDILERGIIDAEGVRVKHWSWKGTRVSAEYEDCAREARLTGKPLMECMKAAEEKALEMLGEG